MIGSFLSSTLWKRLQLLARRATRRSVAVPFVGTGAARRLPLSDGDVLVCRFDRATVRAGLTNPKEILHYLSKGVRVYTVGNLHAKVFILGNTCIVGSPNLSVNSENNLVEAGIETSLPRILRACRAFIESLCFDAVGPRYAEQLAQFYQSPRPQEVPRAGAPARRAFHSAIVVVSLEDTDFDDLDHAADRSAAKAALKRLDAERFVLDSFKWESQLPATIRRGARVIQVVGHGKRARVCPPGRVLTIRHYRSPRGGHRSIVCLEMPKHARARTIGALTRLLGEQAHYLKGLRLVRRLSNRTLVESLDRVWRRT